MNPLKTVQKIYTFNTIIGIYKYKYNNKIIKPTKHLKLIEVLTSLVKTLTYILGGSWVGIVGASPK